MRYASIRSLDISNGEGVGVSLFVQGCDRHCFNCFNSETWNFNGGKEWTEEAKNKFAENDVIKYLNEVVKILKSYNIDSQGFMEYTRAKVENQGIEIEKIWKEIKGGAEKRYVRCILFDFDGKTYLIDTVEQEMKVVNREDLKEFVFNPQEHQYPYYGG